MYFGKANGLLFVPAIFFRQSKKPLKYMIGDKLQMRFGTNKRLLPSNSHKRLRATEKNIKLDVLSLYISL